MAKKQKACLIIHGFTGGPFEVEPLAEYLAHQGYEAVVPTLAGHEQQFNNLGNSSYQDWVASAEIELTKLLANNQKVFIIGFSMGGLIGINLAQKYPIQGLITLSTPIYVLDTKRVVKNVLTGLKNKDYRRINKYAINIIRTPISAVINFKILLSKTKPLIRNISIPLLVIQGLKDDTVKPKSADYIYRTAGSTKKHQYYLKESGHLICCDIEKQLVFEAVKIFLDKLEDE